MTISIAVPVGPKLVHQKWLKECLESVRNQTMKPHDVIIIDDMAGVSQYAVRSILEDISFKIWQAPWNLGVAQAFNFGVALAGTSRVLMLGADDTLEPRCIEQCIDTYIASNTLQDRAYFYLGIRYMDTNEEQYLPCNAAMVTKRLWKHLGGFPVESASGAPDCALISIMLRHGNAAGNLICVNDREPLYNYRRHADTDTAGRFNWQNIILQTRDRLTLDWKPQEWNRNV